MIIIIIEIRGDRRGAHSHSMLLTPEISTYLFFSSELYKHFYILTLSFFSAGLLSSTCDLRLSIEIARMHNEFTLGIEFA